MPVTMPSAGRLILWTDNTYYNAVSGSRNTLAGGTGYSNLQTAVSVFGSNNAVNSIGTAGSQIGILGSNNTVNGTASSRNVIAGHSAVIDGAGNFAAGGNATTGPSVTGNNNIVLGAGASSVVDDGVAIGSGAAATLSIAAAQAAWTGGVVGPVTFTEGTYASGGEMNIGNRLLTGVADGRVATGS